MNHLNFKNFKTIFFLILLIFLSFLSIKQLKKKERSASVSFSSHREYMQDIDLSEFEAGELKHRLQAERWKKESPLESSLEKPKVWIFKTTEEIWTLNAETALLKNKNGQGSIHQRKFYNNILIEKLIDNVSVLKANTQQLNYYPKMDLASSDALVILNKPGLEIEGIGLKADFKSGEIQLKQGVKTRYVAH
ncbi:MAG: LPS export ABC transporter periplasmic protein LptC [Gammaproteobacteria bacterium]